jgi:hypothetical protein
VLYLTWAGLDGAIDESVASSVIGEKYYLLFSAYAKLTESYSEDRRII